MPVLRSLEMPFCTNSPGALINAHEAHEDTADPGLVASVFPWQTIMARLDGAGEGLVIANISDANGGAASEAFPSTRLKFGGYFGLGGTSSGHYFLAIGDTNISGVGGTDGLGFKWNGSNNKVEIYDSIGLLTTSSVAVASGTNLYTEWQIDIDPALLWIYLYRVEGEVHTLIDVIPAVPWNYVDLHNFSYFRNGSQNVDVGGAYVSNDAAFVRIGWRMSRQVAASLGTDQDLNVATAWSTQGGSVLAADVVTSLNSRNCAGGVDTGYLVCPGSATAPKLVSVGLTPCGIPDSATMHYVRFFTAKWQSAAATATRSRPYVIDGGTRFFCNSQATGVQVPIVFPGGLPHGRGYRAGQPNWNVTMPTVARLNAMQVGQEFTVAGAANEHWDSAELFAMFTLAAGGGSLPPQLRVPGSSKMALPPQQLWAA